MINKKKIEAIGSNAVKRLRTTKLSSGKPFMITSKNLPQKQIYLEFPDKSIKIVTIASSESSFTVIDTLDINEANSVRELYGLT